MAYRIEDLNHTETRKRIEAMSAFRQMGEGALPELVAAFEHPALEVRWRAAATLAWLGSAKAVQPLVTLNQGAIYEIKINCTWAMGQINDASAVPHLLSILHAGEDESPDVRYAAALGLARLGQHDALRAAMEDSSPEAYRVAHAALLSAAYL